jgi:hypothetical protein
MAVDEHARRPERNVDGHGVGGPRISCQWSTPRETNFLHVPVGPNGLLQRWAWLFHKCDYANYACRTSVEMSPASPFQMSPSTDCVEELVADDGDSDEPEGDRPDARFA